MPVANERQHRCAQYCPCSVESEARTKRREAVNQDKGVWSWHGTTERMEINGTALQNQPAPCGMGIQALRQSTQPIAKQSTNGRGWNNAPSSLLNHDNTTSVSRGEVLNQTRNQDIPLLVAGIEMPSHKSTQGIDQHIAVGRDLSQTRLSSASHSSNVQ